MNSCSIGSFCSCINSLVVPEGLPPSCKLWNVHQKMILEMLLQEEKRVFNLPDDLVKDLSEGVDAVISKEEPDDGLTEEERRELDKGNDFLADCGCQNIKPPEKPPEKKDTLIELDLSTLSLPSEPREMFLPFKSIIDRRFVEAFPDGQLGDIYGRARTRLPYRVCRFDILS